MKHIEVKIPVKSHVKAFLLEFFPDPYRLSLRNFLGVFLFYLLKKPAKNYTGPRTFDYFDKKTYPEFFIVHVDSHNFFKHRINDVSVTDIIHFNTAMEYLIGMIFNKMIDTSLMPQQKEIKSSILHFLDSFSISEESISFDAFKKKYYRYRKSKQIFNCN